jgi:DNA polymerase-1
MVAMMQWLRDATGRARGLRVRCQGQDLSRRLVPAVQGEPGTAMPDDLSLQIEPIHEVVKLLGWPVLEVPGIEADDAIGTSRAWPARAGHRVIISTGDKDLTQW